MLKRRFDIPFNGPQLMAFVIRRERLEAFTSAYDRALIDADNRGLVELWQANIGRIGSILRSRKSQQPTKTTYRWSILGKRGRS